MKTTFVVEAKNFVGFVEEIKIDRENANVNLVDEDKLTRDDKEKAANSVPMAVVHLYYL